MSSNRRPWYPWYPKDFIVDEKVQSLSPIAELIYRRALDVMWQANDCQLPNVCQKLANQLGKGLDGKSFENAWAEIQHDGFELFKTTDCGKWIYSSRLKIEAEKIETISKKRQQLGKKGGLAKAKAIGKQKPQQTGSHTDTDTDTDNNIPYVEIISYLNIETDKKFRPSSSKTKSCIKARWNEGFRMDDFKHVIAVKSQQWKNDKEMVKFLRPETLFGTKFESYRNEKYNHDISKTPSWF